MIGSIIASILGWIIGKVIGKKKESENAELDAAQDGGGPE